MAQKQIGLCGQAPRDFPEFAIFLVEQGIDSISYNPDALIKGIENIMEGERAHDDYEAERILTLSI